MPRSSDGAPTVPRARPQSYYGRPIIKAPVWKWPIPAYLFTGGLAAGTTMVGAAARLGGDTRLARRAGVAAMVAVGVSGGFLVQDLGKPSRFHHMLRVFKPTSPMSVGTWIFSAFSAAAGGSLAADLLTVRKVRGPWRGLAGAGQVAAAAVAPALATYTAVLIADTAVPTWHEAHRELPFLFAGSAAAAGGATGVLLAGPGPAGTAPRRLALAGAAVELGMDEVMRRRLGELAEPYDEGPAGVLAKAARSATLGGAALLLAGSRRRLLAVAGSVGLIAGSALERFAIFHAGRQSAMDPKYVVGPQRRRLASTGKRA
jgi:hypothetical protein